MPRVLVALLGALVYGGFHLIEPRVYRMVGGVARVEVDLVEGPIYGIHFKGSYGNAFASPVLLDNSPSSYSAADLLDLGCIQWSTDKFYPVRWERFMVINRSLTNINASGPPCLLVYTSDISRPAPTVA